MTPEEMQKRMAELEALGAMARERLGPAGIEVLQDAQRYRLMKDLHAAALEVAEAALAARDHNRWEKMPLRSMPCTTINELLDALGHFETEWDKVVDGAIPPINWRDLVRPGRA